MVRAVCQPGWEREPGACNASIGTSGSASIKREFQSQVGSLSTCRSSSSGPVCCGFAPSEAALIIFGVSRFCFLFLVFPTLITGYRSWLQLSGPWSRYLLVTISRVSVNVLLFEVARQRYALPMDAIREIVRAVSISALPEAPPVVAGVINVRGSVVPVLDMRVRFGANERAVQPSEHFIIVEDHQLPVALRVDRVVEMAQVEDSEIGKVIGVAAATPYVVGTIKMPDGLVLIHDPRAFLSETESIALAEAISSRANG